MYRCKFNTKPRRGGTTPPRVCYTSAKNPPTVYGFAQRPNDLDRICNRASLFDRVSSRVGTRECLKLTCTQRRHVTGTCHPAVFRLFRQISIFSLFFSFLLFLAVRSCTENHSRCTRVRERADSLTIERGGVGRSKSHTGAYEFFKRHDSLRLTSVPLLTLFPGACPTRRYRWLPLRAALIHG